MELVALVLGSPNFSCLEGKDYTLSNLTEVIFVVLNDI